MPQMIGYTALFRNGRLVPGNTPFGVNTDEVPGLQARGFRLATSAGKTEPVPVAEPEPVSVAILPVNDPLVDVKILADEETTETEPPTPEPEPMADAADLVDHAAPAHRKRGKTPPATATE